MEQQTFKFNQTKGDYKDRVIQEIKERLDEKDAEIRSANELAAERWSLIQQLKMERDFYQGAKMERERKYTEEEIQERAAIQAAEGIGLVGAARSEILHTGLSQIPLSALRKIGSIFVEGQLKYGRDNWKKGAFNKSYQQERAEHALVHFLEYLHHESSDGSTPSEQLAKVAWFCVTQIDTLKREEDEALIEDSSVLRAQD